MSPLSVCPHQLFATAQRWDVSLILSLLLFPEPPKSEGRHVWNLRTVSSIKTNSQIDYEN